MSKLKDAIAWIAKYDGPYETEDEGLTHQEKFNMIFYKTSVALVANVFNVSGHEVTREVLRKRGHRAPKKKEMTDAEATAAEQ